MANQNFVQGDCLCAEIKRAWKNIVFWGFCIDCSRERVYDKGMKRNVAFLIVGLVVALTLCFGVTFAHGQVAWADQVQVETFCFDADGNDFVVTRFATNEEIFRGLYHESNILKAIKAIVGDSEYNIVLSAPTVSVTLTSEGAVQPYSSTNLFKFGAVSTHGFENMGIKGYSGADHTTGYNWRFSRDGGAETPFGGHGNTMPFGANNAYGKYDVYAYATITLLFDGKYYKATGKSDPVTVEIDKANANVPDISESALNISTHYGKTVGEYIEECNVKSRSFVLVATDGQVTDDVLSVGTYGVEVEYVVGDWINGVFQKDESVNAVKLSLTINVMPYEVFILIHHVIVKEGDAINLSYELLFPTELPNNETLDDLDVNLYANNVGSRVGKYDIVAESGNKNYRLYYNNYENLDNRDYSTSATLTIRPQQISAEHDGVRYTFYRPDGFQYDDELVIAEVYGDNSREGAKSIKIYNNNQSMVYTDLTLTIEKIADTVQNIVMFENGAWVEKPFDAEGKIVVPYSTEQGNGFQVVVVHGSSQTKQGNETLAYCLMAGFVAIFLGSQGYMARKRRYPKDIYVREVRPTPEKAVQVDPPIEQTELVQKGVDAPKKKVRLSLDEKLALHPEFVPTPTVDEAFKEKGDVDEDLLDKDNEVEDDDNKITFRSKMLSASIENKAIYNALKNQLLSYRGVKSRVVNGGDYFRRPGKQIVKIIFIGKTIRLALALNPEDYDYNLYHQKDRSAMKKYADTPMFVKVQSPLGVRRAFKLISDLMAKEGIHYNKKYLPDDHLYDLAYGEDEE